MTAQSKIEPPDNLAIWNALAKTDPRATKGFKRAGGFTGTAIKPIWIIQRLTEQFGPVGVGWGMGEPAFQLVPAGDELLVFCTIRCWHGTPENGFFGVGGDKAVARFSSGFKSDDEAFKKAFTDAIGNAFKFVGVGADVHMGLFDDSKYVRDTAQEFAANDPANDAAGGHSQREKGAVSPRQQPPTVRDQLEQSLAQESDRAPRGRRRAEGEPSKSELDTAEKELVSEIMACADTTMLDIYLKTDGAKRRYKLLKDFRPSAIEGPPPDDCPEYVPLAELILSKRAEFAREETNELARDLPEYIERGAEIIRAG